MKDNSSIWRLAMIQKKVVCFKRLTIDSVRYKKGEIYDAEEQTQDKWFIFSSITEAGVALYLYESDFTKHFRVYPVSRVMCFKTINKDDCLYTENQIYEAYYFFNSGWLIYTADGICQDFSEEELTKYFQVLHKDYDPEY